MQKHFHENEIHSLSVWPCICTTMNKYCKHPIISPGLVNTRRLTSGLSGVGGGGYNKLEVSGIKAQADACGKSFDPLQSYIPSSWHFFN